MKILFVTSRMGIGGAETHIVGVASELAKGGHKIFIASSGGELCKMLDDKTGHFTLPLDKKNPISVLRSLFSLHSIIKNEKFDIIHAHSRIPAFLCGLLIRFTPFRLVTTAHLDFKCGILGKLSTWGEKTLAVSQDIKDYLIKEYKIFPDNISVTVNGIDTKYFSPRKENKSEEGTEIVHISRFDRDRSMVAFMLVEAVVKLREIYNVSLTLVGDGEDMRRLSYAVNEANKKIGNNSIHLYGAKSEILPFLERADIFVGVSRAALEAMSCGIPTILAGNQGYLGIYDKTLKKKAAATNFCCRGEKLPTVESLIKSIESLIKATEKERGVLGEQGRDTVLEDYTISKTAKDYLDLYTSLSPIPNEKKGFLLCGYFGYKNVGDEAILEAEIKEIKKVFPNFEITVMSISPKLTARAYHVRAINRYLVPKILYSMKKNRYFMFGGGGLLQDSTSVRSLIYYCFMIFLAKKMKMKVIVSANGIGKLKSKFAKRMVSKTLSNIDELSVRDNNSAELLKQIGIKEKITLKKDPAFDIRAVDESRILYILNRAQISGRYFVLCLRNYERFNIDFLSSLASFCLRISDYKNFLPVIVEMQEEIDREVSENASRLIPGSVVLKKLSPSEALGIISHAEFTIGMRLHSLIFSKSAGVPFFALSYDDKVKAFAKENGALGYIEI